MRDRGHLYLSESILLTSVVVPLALAEGVWRYWAAAVLGVIGGWWTTLRRDRPGLGPRSGQVAALAAFGLLVFEYGWVSSMPAIIALSHFMILVCITKLLQRRTLRDDAQVIVLCLLLLVVAAIVSGHLWFAAVLGIYLTIGLNALIRHHLRLEAARADRRNRNIHPLLTPGDGMDDIVHRRALTGVTALAAMTAVAIGVAVFVLFPRVGADMFGQLNAPGGGHAVTGFADSVGFHTAGPIKESNRAAMRVRMEYEDGIPARTGIPFYFRGTVLEQYRDPDRLAQKERVWQRGHRRDSDSRPLRLQPVRDSDKTASLLAVPDPRRLLPTLVQRYYLEPNREPYLFTCYPALEISSRDLDQVTKCLRDQVLQVAAPPERVLRYTVRSPIYVSPWLAAVLAEERPAGAEPRALPPDPPLDREAEILALIDRVAGDVGPLDEPANRMAFVNKLADYLGSEAFTYTLDPPRVRDNREPIGEFLLETRRGHCEYFASALAVMCQLKGIPARLVNGYRTGDYNPVGQFYLVRRKHAHAWVEAFIPGMDWVTFDPTPAGTGKQEGAGLWLLQLRRYVDYFQFHWGNLVVAYDADLRQAMFDEFRTWLRRPAKDQRTAVGAVAAFVRELFGWRLKLTSRERLIYWVFSLLVVALVVLVGYVLSVVLRWLASVLSRLYLARSAAARVPETEFYHRFCRRLARLGLRRRTDQTPGEFAEDLARQSPALAEAPELVRAYYEVVFGGLELSASRRSRIEAILKRLRRVDASALTVTAANPAAPAMNAPRR